MANDGRNVRVDDETAELIDSVVAEIGGLTGLVCDLAVRAGLGDTRAQTTLAMMRNPATRTDPHTLGEKLRTAGIFGRVLAVRQGLWEDSDGNDPMGRAGFGYKPEASDRERAETALGYWLIDARWLPTTRYLLSYRHGEAIGIYRLDPDRWQQWGRKSYATNAVELMTDGRTQDPITGTDRGPQFAAEALLVETVTTTRLVVPPPGRNPIAWICR